jgi:hypothetical protein
MPQIDENSVQIVEDDTAIQYFVSSCLTVTCGFRDGTRIGAHFSHGETGTNWTYADSVQTWDVFKETVGNKVLVFGGATWVVVRGQIDMWRPDYLTTARLASDYAAPGDLSDTISMVTGRAPDIDTKTDGFVVMADGQVV